MAVVYPDLLGTYGDGGNGVILARRAAWRGIDVDLVQAPSDRPLPTADLYTIGGGEDGPQVRATTGLLEDGTLAARVAEGAVVLAVCAGFQVIGGSFPDSAGRAQQGVGSARPHHGEGDRAPGPWVSWWPPRRRRRRAWRPASACRASPASRTTAVCRSWARARTRSPAVEHGVGNGGGDGTEGAWSGRVLGTYLHGPVLARNTALADLLLGWALAPADAPEGTGVALEPLDDVEELALRSERLEAVGRAAGGWRALARRVAMAR